MSAAGHQPAPLDPSRLAELVSEYASDVKAHDIVEVRRATARTRLLRVPQKNFFSVLRTKLKWGER